MSVDRQSSTYHFVHPHRKPGPLTKALTSALAAVLTIGLLIALAFSARATDTLPWAMTNAKYAAGQNQPYQHGYSGLDILNWNPEADQYSQYLRARVPLQPRIAANAATQRDPSLPADTEMFDLSGDYGNAFFESFQDNNVFSQYLFNYWQYTDYFGSWHGQPTQGVDSKLYDPTKDWTQKWFEFGVLNLPNPAYTNAAHKNGVKSIGTIFFSDNDRGEQTYRDLFIGRQEDGKFPIADKLVEIARYFGFDGYFINQESDVEPSDIGAYQDFLKQMVDQGTYIQWYDSARAQDGTVDYQNMFNASNSPWVQDPSKGKISDSIFLNYWYDKAMIKDSADHARSLGLDPKQSVFAGLEAGQKKFDDIAQNAAYMQANLGDDGKPLVSLATLGPDFVSHELGDSKKVKAEYQNEVFDRERRLWTGSSQGDGTDQADGWKGFSSQIAERSVLGGSVFSTSFNTGHGLEWRDRGKVSSDQEWGNINLQDTPVTWQWWVDSKDQNRLQADFDYGPQYQAASRFDYQKLGAYEGGSSLALSGKLSADNTVRLFKTDLKLNQDSTISVTYNKPVSDDSSLKLGLVFSDNSQTVIPVDLSDGSATQGWRTVTVNLGGYSGKQLDTIAVIAKAGASPIDHYQVNIGQMSLADAGHRTAPAQPTGLKLEHFDPSTAEATLRWDMADYGQVKNYLVYLDSTFLGGRYDDNLYIKKLPKTTGTLKLYAVGADGSRSLAAQTSLDASQAVSNLETSPAADGTMEVSWKNPALHADKVVTVSSARGSWRYSDHVYQQSQQVGADQTSLKLSDLPVDGSGYIVTVSTQGGSDATATGNFVDRTIEPYPVCSVVWNSAGNQVTMVRPQTQDWRYVYVIERWMEQGVQKEETKPVQYTYSQQTPPVDGIIRGRTKPVSYQVPVSHGGDVWVSYEDYRGNKTQPVKVPGPKQIATCTQIDPTKPDSQTSSASALDGQALADGKSKRSVQVKVKDTFGNPQVGSSVTFELPKELAQAQISKTGALESRTVGQVDLQTDSSGQATLDLVSSTPGSFTVNATLEGMPIGKGVEISFLPISTSEAKPGPSAGVTPEHGGTVGASASDPEAAKSLSATGVSIAVPVTLSLLTALLAGLILGIGRRSSR